MGAKASFDEVNKIINLIEAPDINGDVYISVKTDLYSDGKEDWIANENLRKFQFPISAVGGQDLPGELALGATFFLAADWKIRPYSSHHRLIVTGNLYSADGTDPFLDPESDVTVRIMSQISALVFRVETGVSGLTQSESDKLLGLPSLNDIGTEIDNSTILAKEATLVDRPTLSDIEGSAVLAKEATILDRPILSEIEGSSVLAKEATVSNRPTLSEIENSAVLAKEATLSNRPTLSEIEGSDVLAKEATVDAISSDVRTELTPELTEISIIKSFIANRMRINKSTGDWTVYADDGLTPLFTGSLSDDGTFKDRVPA